MPNMNAWTFTCGRLVDIRKWQEDFLAKLWAPADERFSVYHQNWQAGAARTLAEMYPAVKVLWGEAAFAQAAADFQKARPARSPDLYDFGSAFPDYLQDLGDYPRFRDLAALEGQRYAAFLATGERGSDLADLALLALAEQARVRFLLAPGLALLHSPYELLPLLECTNAASEPAEERIYLTWRDREYIVSTQEITVSAAAVLTALRAGKRLEELSAAEAAALASAASLGWITGFTLA